MRAKVNATDDATNRASPRGADRATSGGTPIAATGGGLRDGLRGGQTDWLRLRTLVLLRWGAIAGQVTAILVAYRFFDIDLPLGACLLAVGAAVVANLVAIAVVPQSLRLTETQATLTFLFDLAQIAVLLFLTGGLGNPFALMILGPATIAATALPPRPTLFLMAMTVAFVSLVSVFNIPLTLTSGVEIAVPRLFAFGHWLAVVVGVVFFGLYAGRVAGETRAMGDALLATQLALAREQKLTDLGGVVAAAAHEFGTPLATIKLVSTELADELAARPDLRADAELIRLQADRCAEILRSMGRAGKDDTFMRSAPLGALVREAAEPHAGRGTALHFRDGPGPGGSDRPPVVHRRPEIIHGLRNLIQNAVDFARGNVWIDTSWTPRQVTIRIVDDGPGIPAHLLGRVGEPFMRHRRQAADAGRRAEYEGMGLGLFIAKTLLQRTGAVLSFANATDPFLTEAERPPRSGAIVEVIWPREAIEAPEPGPIGDNLPIPV